MKRLNRIINTFLKLKFHTGLSIKECLMLGVIAGMITLASSCKKDTVGYQSTAAIQIINAVGGVPVKVNVNASSSFSWAIASNIAYSAGAYYGAIAGNNAIKVVKSADTTATVFNRTVNLQSISTLYLAGDASNVDTVFRQEMNFPFIDAARLNPDNSLYVRFVNLSPNSRPLNINIAGSPTNEVAGLAYKGISSFKKYAAELAAGSVPATADYNFEIRDAATSTLVATAKVVVSSTRYKTAVVVIRGTMPPIPIPSPAPVYTYPFGTFQVNYN